jgi:Transposase DDE domain group 1
MFICPSGLDATARAARIAKAATAGRYCRGASGAGPFWPGGIRPGGIPAGGAAGRDAPAALRAIRSARSAARQRAWALAGDAAPGADGGLIPVDIDATIVTAHSDKNQAAPTWKKSFGFHPLTVFADHGPDGSGEPPETSACHSLRQPTQDHERSRIVSCGNRNLSCLGCRDAR